MKKIFTQTISFTLALLLFAGISIIYAWTEPTQAPPSGNVAAPLNVSSVSQYKSGALGVGGVFHGYSTGIFDGNVGIGTASPSQKLDVAGYIKGQTGLCIGSDCRNAWPTTQSIQKGTASAAAPQNVDEYGDYSSNHVNFPSAFSSVPVVVATAIGMCNPHHQVPGIGVYNVSTTGFDFYWVGQADQSCAGSIYWIAVQ